MSRPTRPARDESILACSRVLHRYIVEGGSGESKERGQFDIDRFVRPTYNVKVPASAQAVPFAVFKQTQKTNSLPHPDVQKIYRLIKRVFDKARLHAEAVIVALIYIERLVRKGCTHLCERNWIPIVLTALLAASKMWDDHSSYNAEFADILPFIGLQDVNDLERLFFDAIEWDLSISSSEYAKTYFRLRELRAVRLPNRSAPPAFGPAPSGSGKGL